MDRRSCPLVWMGIMSFLVVMVMTGWAAGAEMLRVAPLVHDCGVIDEGTPAMMTVILENVSDREIHILNVRTN